MRLSVVKNILRNVPGARALLGFIRAKSLQRRSAEDVFTSIYQRNGWSGRQSVSGRGSDDDQTGEIVSALPGLLEKHSVKKMLDIPCGDFHWMDLVALDGVSYVGADIVKDLIEKNVGLFGTEHISFQQLDLRKSDLPHVDLILCRDCLVHLSFADIHEALENIKRSGASFLLTTTFDDRKENRDIATGNWRPLNFRLAPFNFPAPLESIDEKCTEGNGNFADKRLALWNLNEIPV